MGPRLPSSVWPTAFSGALSRALLARLSRLLDDMGVAGWSDLVSQAVSALVGTLVGGAITVLVARWQTERTITAQTDLALTQEAAASRLARSERERERATVAAIQLLEGLATLYAWLPSLPDVSEEIPRLSVHAREECRAALQALRRGMMTDLFAISDTEVRSRYRALVKLVYDAGWRGQGREHPERLVTDVRGYLRFVQFSLEAVTDGSPLPSHVSPPVLERPEADLWIPPQAPEYWGDPADES